MQLSTEMKEILVSLLQDFPKPCFYPSGSRRPNQARLDVLKVRGLLTYEHQNRRLAVLLTRSGYETAESLEGEMKGIELKQHFSRPDPLSPNMVTVLQTLAAFDPQPHHDIWGGSTVAALCHRGLIRDWQGRYKLTRWGREEVELQGLNPTQEKPSDKERYRLAVQARDSNTINELVSESPGLVWSAHFLGFKSSEQRWVMSVLERP